MIGISATCKAILRCAILRLMVWMLRLGFRYRIAALRHVAAGQSGRDSGLNALFFKVGDVELNAAEVFGNQPFSSLIFDYDTSIPVTALKLEPHAVNDAASISIMKEGDNTNYFARKSSGDTTGDIMLATGGTATILKVIVADAKPTTYTFTIRSEVPISITNADGSEIDEVNEGGRNNSDCRPSLETSGITCIHGSKGTWNNPGGKYQFHVDSSYS